MGLVYLTDREGAGNALMAALHGTGILRIERASLLVYHDSVRAQGIKAVAVKLTGKESLRRPEGIR